MAGGLLYTGVTEGKGTVLEVTVLKVVALLMGGCTIEEVSIGADPVYGDASPLEAEADGLVKLDWRTDVVKRVTMAGGTEDIGGLGAKLGC